MKATPPIETPISKDLTTLRESMIYNKVQVYDEEMVYSFKGGDVRNIVHEFNNKINELSLDNITATCNWLTNTVLVKGKG